MTGIRILAIAYEGELACASGRREPSDCAYIQRAETEEDRQFGELPTTIATYDGIVEARWPLAEALEAAMACCVRCCDERGCTCNEPMDDDAEYVDRLHFERSHSPGAAA